MSLMAKSSKDGDKLILLKEGDGLHLPRVDGPQLGDLLQTSLNIRLIKIDILASMFKSCIIFVLYILTQKECIFIISSVMYIPGVEAAERCHYKPVHQQPRSIYQA